jgi:hypothetical protein
MRMDWWSNAAMFPLVALVDHCAASPPFHSRTLQPLCRRQDSSRNRHTKRQTKRICQRFLVFTRQSYTPFLQVARFQPAWDCVSHLFSNKQKQKTLLALCFKAVPLATHAAQQNNSQGIWDMPREWRPFWAIPRFVKPTASVPFMRVRPTIWFAANTA